MNKDLIKATEKPVKEVVNDIVVNQKLINGTQLLIIFYSVIILYFLIDIFVVYRLHKSHGPKPGNFGPVESVMYRVYILYHKYGFISINFVIYIVCIGLIIYSEGFSSWVLFLQVTASIVAFTVIAKILLRVFINKNNYEDDWTIRFMNIILYVILGNFFCFSMRFISRPNLLLCLSGLTFSLLLCFYIMLHAIFNPEILKKSANTYLFYSQAFGIIKGMSAILLCMLTTLYLMIYCCYRTHPEFYALEYLHSMDNWDIVYYLVESFTTIGYGDIVPVRYNGMFYSEYVAILIGFASMFTSTCFVAAVISTANSIAKNTRDRVKESSVFEKLNENKVQGIIMAALKAYEEDKEKKHKKKSA